MGKGLIGVIGGGAWGTALAQTECAAGREVLLWAHEAETVDEINGRHCNQVFLPHAVLDPRLRATDDLEDFGAASIVLMVAPAQHMRRVAGQLRPHLADGCPVVVCAKGIEQSTGKLMSDVIEETLPEAPLAVLSGPSFAGEVARGLPTAVTLATSDEAEGEALANDLGHKTFRAYWSRDVVGAEVGGAIKNVLAIAAGIVEGKALGASARAALVTRGFAELVRFGEAFGADRVTLNGLSGLGDLVLTCTSSQSRNMSLGRALGEGQTLDDVLGARRSVAEGVFTAGAVHKVGAERGLDLPICEAVHRVVSGALSVDDAIEDLLSRPFRSETE
ncbi:MAG: NAD(P)H-dependent glycerol-3-phosphate dehydrogenase [Hyphomicrobiaceae bacterium]